MSGYLVDTNVISKFVKVPPDANVRLWFEDEGHSGTMGTAHDPSKETRRDGRHGRLPNSSHSHEHDLVVVTRNVKDFTALGVPVLSPWDLGG